VSNLISLDNISVAFGFAPLLDKINFQMAKGERVCLIGRNGAGKSTLLKIIEGNHQPDSGETWRKPHLRIARLEQELPQNVLGTVYEYVAEGLAETGQLLKDYHTLTQALSHAHTSAELSELERLQHAIEAKNGWQYEQDINTVLTRLDLSADKHVSELSGGWQRRVALAKALVAMPELLLLDEPTNHLDIEAIQWLENQLISCDCGLLFITHDRALLKRLATRIVELDRGQLTSWPGDYDNFLRRKEEMLQAEVKQQSDFDKKLAQEEVWIRQGIKARRTRNEGRVRALEALRVERAKRRVVQGKATFNVNQAEKSGQLVIDVKNVTHQYHDQMIIKNFSMRIMRGDRIGLIGPNGVGKSTLLNILLDELKPQTGSVIHGTKLQVAYFDQLRRSLDLEKTVRENVAPGTDFIEVNGKRRHIISYLGDFLFSPERAMTPVKALSGGECNRLLLARMFTQPANLLVLDEPTNDLDIETLELLEELLCNYQGTLLLVSHDRAFLDNVVTSTLVFKGQGKIEEFIGGYQDWLRQDSNKVIKDEQSKSVVTSQQDTKAKINATQDQEPSSNKLSFKDQRELSKLPMLIEKLEAEQSDVHHQVADPRFYQQDEMAIAKVMERLKKIEHDLSVAYQRWETLEGISKK
jgi:ATP-binding cassette subfamily F protein uup